jgi:hypothetical protein
MFLRTLQRAALEAKREAGEAERRRLESLRQQLRGRQYAYDHHGQVVLVSPIEPHKLPRPMTPRIGTDTDAASAAAKKKDAGGSPQAGAPGPGGAMNPCSQCQLTHFATLSGPWSDH